MNIVCVGAGPSGLYFAVLMKLRHPEYDITVIERHPVGSTFGWGLGFFDELLEELQENDPDTHQSIADAAFRWEGQAIDVDGHHTFQHVNSGYSIRRQTLLNILAERAINLGVKIEYGREVHSRSELLEADLIVASDGVNSRLRESESEHFGSSINAATNRFLWLGTTQIFPSFMALFAKTEAGWIWAEGCGVGDTSAFVVECAPDTWERLSFGTRSKSDVLGYLEGLFAEHLEGHPLMSQIETDGPLPWLNFRTLTNEQWHSDNLVLLGDAAHTTHYSIGSGTTSALEDSIALVNCLDAEPDLESAFQSYEEIRKAALVRTQTEAKFSALWLEQISRYINHTPNQFLAMWEVRRSPVLSRMPPLLYYRLHQLSSIPILKGIRDQIGVRVRSSTKEVALKEKQPA